MADETHFFLNIIEIEYTNNSRYEKFGLLTLCNSKEWL